MWRNHCESHCANVLNNASPSANHARNGGRSAARSIGDQMSVTAAPTQNATRIARKSRATRRAAERGTADPRPGLCQTRVEIVLGAPAELAFGARDVEDAAVDLAWARFRVHRVLVDAGNTANHGVEIHDRRLDARADVEDAAVGIERTERGGRDVADVDEVARLLPVAEDARRSTFGELAHEDRDDAALEVRLLPRPVNVRVPDDDVTRSVQPVVGPEVLLGGEL